MLIHYPTCELLLRPKASQQRVWLTSDWKWTSQEHCTAYIYLPFCTFLINASIIFLITCSLSSLIKRPSTHTEQMLSHLPLTISTLKRIRWLFINKNVFFFLGTINAPPFHSIFLLCVRCLSVKQKRRFLYFAWPFY